jgi:hypothetical protein
MRFRRANVIDAAENGQCYFYRLAPLDFTAYCWVEMSENTHGDIGSKWSIYSEEVYRSFSGVVKKACKFSPRS